MTSQGTARIRTAKYDPDTLKFSFNSYLTVPDGTTICQAGLVAAKAGNGFDPDNSELTVYNADFTKYARNAVGASAPVNYTWNKTRVMPGDVWYARAIVTYTLNGETRTVYGALAKVEA